VQQSKRTSRTRQLDPTGRWVVSCAPQTFCPLERCRRCLLDRRASLLVWALWTQSVPLLQIVPQVSAC